MDTLSDPEFAGIFMRIEKRISLLGCNTPFDIIDRLREHPMLDERMMTLISHGFQQRAINDGWLKGWREENAWSGRYDGKIVRVRRYAKGMVIDGKNVGGRFMKGGMLVFDVNTLKEMVNKGLYRPVRRDLFW